MRFGINFRRDLAKLDDVELASRYEALIDKRAAALDQGRSRLPKSMHWLAGCTLGWRGPFHARTAYKVLAFVICVLGQAPYEAYLLYLEDCELMDVTDEIQSRIRRRATQRGAAGAPL